jgi:nucleotide-binding universal stress UspA family protein
MKKLDVILHPTDFSANAKHAMELACGVARDRGARLIVLHVAPPIPAQWTGSGTSLLHSHKHRWDAENRLRQVSCRDLRPERWLRTGEPATVIVTVAKQVNADLIVIGQPQPSRWRWLVEERVAETLTRTAPCPLLIATTPDVRAPERYAERGKSLRRQDRPLAQPVSFSPDDRVWTY